MTDPVEPVELISVSSEFEADLIANELKEHGVEASTTGGFISGFKAAIPANVAVLVHASDLEKAEKALEVIRQEVAEIDWSKIDATEGGETEGEEAE